LISHQRGVAQVSSTAATLVGAGKLLDPSRLAHVFVSPRKRARRTFELLLSGAVENVTITDDIAEWDYGDYEGLKAEEIRGLRKEKSLDPGREWDIWSDGCEGGE
jgi:broad specificity phosphatase PhoE